MIKLIEWDDGWSVRGQQAALMVTLEDFPTARHTVLAVRAKSDNNLSYILETSRGLTCVLQ